MKRIFLSMPILAIVLVLTLQIFSDSTAARTIEDYPLMCRGGGTLVTGIAPGERNIGFSFTRGSKPAGEGLAPGECSWMDRGMYTNEPDRLSQHVEDTSDSLKVGGTLAPENRWYEELHSSDSYWTFMVSNNGRGQLIATSARPNRDRGFAPSSTARLPGGIGQIRIPDLPRARTLDDETPKMILLNGPPEPASRTEMLEGFPVGRSSIVVPGPPDLSTEEQMRVLKSAGFGTLSEPPTPYVTLTPKEPLVAGRGRLAFYYPAVFEPDSDHTVWQMNDSEAGRPPGSLSIGLTFETPGKYWMTLSFKAVSLGIKLVKPPITGFPETFVLNRSDGTKETLSPGKKTSIADDWQRWNIFLEVAKPGTYYFGLEAQSKNENRQWLFHSCEVVSFK
ncbi:MAG: hypothetical protein M3R67_12330 [Acidobacteriota bacterium]|nr:hypothetical protein [Acidobacteriota bacterium]